MTKNELRIHALEKASASKPTIESATESFKRCGIMDGDGRIKEDYKNIFIPRKEVKETE